MPFYFIFVIKSLKDISFHGMPIFLHHILIFKITLKNMSAFETIKLLQLKAGIFFPTIFKETSNVINLHYSEYTNQNESVV